MRPSCAVVECFAPVCTAVCMCISVFTSYTFLKLNLFNNHPNESHYDRFWCDRLQYLSVRLYLSDHIVDACACCFKFGTFQKCCPFLLRHWHFLMLSSVITDLIWVLSFLNIFLPWEIWQDIQRMMHCSVVF